MSKRNGFTLVEVMISMFIMAMLTVLVSQSIRTAVQNKRKLEAKMANEITLYDALRVMKLDVERAFHYQDVFFEIENLAIKQLEKEKDKDNPDSAPPEQRTPPIQLTQFLGEASSMHFTVLNHFRTQYNAQESDQMEVGYFVDNCERPDGKGSTRCLWRRSNPQIDDQVDQDGPKVVVAHNVKEFSLQYHSNKLEDEWYKQWRSDNKGRNQHRNRFPHFVKIKLVIHDVESKTTKPVEQTVVVQISFPNNESHMQQQAQQQNGQNPQDGGNPQ